MQDKNFEDFQHRGTWFTEIKFDAKNEVVTFYKSTKTKDLFCQVCVSGEGVEETVYASNTETDKESEFSVNSLPSALVEWLEEIASQLEKEYYDE